MGRWMVWGHLAVSIDIVLIHSRLTPFANYLSNVDGVRLRTRYVADAQHVDRNTLNLLFNPNAIPH